MRRVLTTVHDPQARERLKAYRATAGFGPHKAGMLAEIIWPDTKWKSAQGAGAAASRVLKRLGCKWTVNGSENLGYDWGWLLTFE